ncbi:hypothetical protein S7711_01534 [Stachybotrys chartarum IBT 7711]|uniref:Uncharacterized protein n=1 Tax=Stachybotrys chartarum (strain CBS 109288 / IBT 7711) TaxID=1280523 RepID=A0A084BBZ1_STACB|nr:hypothetical protein S7711_01534 [Stachybotrys chartarum IBT 7711]KFA55914.1 hypothetical protein S40293_06939 [Stachybotrys chartarum IBT 40293]
MFATQHYMEAMPDPARKRVREEDDLPNGCTSFNEHRSKRIQCLPLRTSPTSAQRNAPAAISTNQFDADPNTKSHFSSWTSPSAQGLQMGQDSDMMDTVASSLHNASYAEPVQYHPDPEPSVETGRMPTPIQPSFAAQLRGQQCEWSTQGSNSASVNGTVNLGHHAGFTNHSSVPRTMGSEGNWQTSHNTRRLPSPISEAEDSCTHESTDASEAYDGQATSHAGLSPHSMEHPNAMMDVESPHVHSHTDSDGDPASPSPRSRGHMRSKHTINNWTQQPGMKKSFSIGYRADCEKCRLKVPGHFNHIIIS